MPKRFCLDCGALGPWKTGRCPPCQARARPNTTKRGLGHEHRKRAAAVLAAAQVCHWCGKPPRPDDPLTADHDPPRAHGGTRRLVAAHASCNSSRGGKTRKRNP